MIEVESEFKSKMFAAEEEAKQAKAGLNESILVCTCLRRGGANWRAGRFSRFDFMHARPGKASLRVKYQRCARRCLH